MRCSPLATEGGASICTTRSIDPMSMPSSSDEVATRPAVSDLELIFNLHPLLARQRADRTRDGFTGGSFMAAANRSASRQLF
jgi:hypothetical protein